MHTILSNHYNSQPFQISCMTSLNLIMDSLLCTEEWFMSPTADPEKLHANQLYNPNTSDASCHMTTVQDFEDAFGNFLGKEIYYMPELGYLNHVMSNSFIGNVRFKAIYWLIKSQWRLNLSAETVLCAANYIDRFISLKLSQSWKDWMFELLAVASLSVASKYNETVTPTFRDIQMEDLECSYESRLIQRMELTLLKALKWRLGTVTPYSYVELLTRSIDSLHNHLCEEFTGSVTKLLLNALLDSKFVEFRPSVIAISAVEYISKELHLSSMNSQAFLNNFKTLIPKELEDDLSKCYKMMEECNLGKRSIIYSSYPSSPVTVLATQHYNFSDFQIDLSLLNSRNIDLNLCPGRKRKRPEEQDEPSEETGKFLGEPDSHAGPWTLSA